MDSSVIQNSALKLDSQMEIANKYLTPKAKEALSKPKLLRMTETDSRGKPVGVCMWFVTKVKRDNIESGVQKICTSINYLADNGLIRHMLSDVVSIDLMDVPFQEPSSVVICYPIVPIEKYEELKKNKYYLEEGQIPPCEDDLTPMLKNGEFLAEVRIYQPMLLVKDYGTEKQLLNRKIKQYLAVLHKDTRVLNVKKCGTTGLSLTYEIKFFNHLYSTIKKVDLEFARDIAESVDPNPKHQYTEFDQLLRVRYFDKDDKELYVSMYGNLSK